MSELTCASTPYANNNPNNNFHLPDSSAPLYELQQVIQQYQAQPELLKLILTSKVEEDKRRAEEAKLRAKELDYYMKHDSPPPPPTLLPPINHQSKMPIPSRNITKNERNTPYSSPSRHRRSIQSSSERPLDDDQDYQQRRHSAATAMLAMGSSLSPASPPSPSSLSDSANQTSDEDIDQSAYPSPLTDHYEDQDEEGQPRRRRREMHAITKIVETRDFPYLDPYFWRNNGNTTQKKTGCRSIYYKCSNSNKGCKVNKTVTAKPNGEYLIKYRGSHLPECGMVERICDL